MDGLTDFALACCKNLNEKNQLLNSFTWNHGDHRRISAEIQNQYRNFV